MARLRGLAGLVLGGGLRGREEGTDLGFLGF